MLKIEARLSQESENRIIDAIDKVATLINNDCHPNEAIAKVASEMKIPAGHIEMVTHAYNTGRTNMQRRNGNDTFDKAASFPLADTQTILKLMFPANYKTAAEIYRETDVSDEYNHQPLWAARIPTKESEFNKAAFFKEIESTKLEIKPPTYPEINHYKKAQDEIFFKRRQLEEFRRQKSALADDIKSVQEKLANYFKSHGSRPFKEVVENSTLLFGNHVPQSLSFIKETFTTKSAASKWVPVSVDQTPYREIVQLLRLQNAFNEFSEKYAKAEELFTNWEGELVRPFSIMETQSSVINDLLEKDAWTPDFSGFLGPTKSLFSTGQSMFGGNEFSKGLSEASATKPTSKLIEKDYEDFASPQHQEDMREVEVEAMLNDLMANDDVISGHDPEEVIRIFNEVNQVAPRAANQKMLMRALIRKRLEYGGDRIDPVDVAQLLDIENKIREREGAPTKALMPIQSPASRPAG